MYNNNSYDQYMQEVLGYSMPGNIYQRNSIDSYPSNIYNFNINSNQNLENFYPEIYQIVYPMVKRTCSNVYGNVTEDVIENMTEKIYSHLENDERYVSSNNTAKRTNEQDQKKNDDNKDKKAEEVRSQNFILKDLIKILLLRELSCCSNRPPRPPRPPFPRPNMDYPYGPMEPNYGYNQGMGPMRPREYDEYPYQMGI